MARTQSGFMKPIFAFSIAVTWKQHFFAEIPGWVRLSVWTSREEELMVAPARNLRDYIIPIQKLRSGAQTRGTISEFVATPRNALGLSRCRRIPPRLPRQPPRSVWTLLACRPAVWTSMSVRNSQEKVGEEP